MVHVDCLELVLTTKIFSHVLYGSSRLDKIHTFPSLVERELEIQELYLCLFFSGVFSKYNNPVFEISEWWLGGVPWSEVTVECGRYS